MFSVPLTTSHFLLSMLVCVFPWKSVPVFPEQMSTSPEANQCYLPRALKKHGGKNRHGIKYASVTILSVQLGGLKYSHTVG